MKLRVAQFRIVTALFNASYAFLPVEFMKSFFDAALSDHSEESLTPVKLTSKQLSKTLFTCAICYEKFPHKNELNQHYYTFLNDPNHLLLWDTLPRHEKDKINALIVPSATCSSPLTPQVSDPMCHLCQKHFKSDDAYASHIVSKKDDPAHGQLFHQETIKNPMFFARSLKKKKGKKSDRSTRNSRFSYTRSVDVSPKKEIRLTTEEFPPLASEKSKSHSVSPKPTKLKRKPKDKKTGKKEFASYWKAKIPPLTTDEPSKNPGNPHLSPELHETLMKLTESVQKFYASQKLTPAVLASRQELIKRLAETVSRCFKGTVHFSVFGSVASELSSNTSDLDISLDMDKNVRRHTATSYIRKQSVDVLYKLSEALREEKYGVIKPILSARVPIVKLTDSATNIECDFAFGVPNHQVKSEFLRLMSHCDPRLEPLVFASKYWSKRRFIGDASKGSLNSFGHTLLMIHYLQVCEPPVLPVFPLCFTRCRQGGGLQMEWDTSVLADFRVLNGKSIGELLFGYFEYYAVVFDCDKHCVSVRERALMEVSGIARRKKFEELQRIAFCVEDPLDVTDNVGRNLTDDAAFRIITEFRRAFNVLKEGASFDVLCEKLDEVPFGYMAAHRTRGSVESEGVAGRGKVKQGHELSSPSIHGNPGNDWSSSASAGNSPLRGTAAGSVWAEEAKRSVI